MSNSWIEWLGYLASIMIAISMFMKDISKLRVINFIGCIIFIAYGFLIKAYPVAIVNFIIAITNVYYLYKDYREKVD